jgi:hypothetical protein
LNLLQSGADIDIRKSRNKINEHNDILKDRRPEYYQELIKISKL